MCETFINADVLFLPGWYHVGGVREWTVCCLCGDQMKVCTPFSRKAMQLE